MQDANDLYSYFLMDVEMLLVPAYLAHCAGHQLRAALCATCFLSIEDSILVDSKTDSAWLQWQWMKNSRSARMD